MGFNISKQKNKEDIKISDLLQNTYFKIGSISETLRLYFELLADEINNKPIGCSETIKNIMSLLLINLVRSYTDGKTIESNELPISDNQCMHVIEHCFRNNCATITETELSERLNLSRRQLLRFFFKNYDKTFSQMKRESRIDCVKKMLKKGISAEETALAVGYTDFVHFKKIMKSTAGI